MKNNFKGYFLVFSITCTFHAHASINEYIYPYSSPSYSNYGTIGLVQMPSARFQPEASLALSWSHNDPYIRGSLIAYPFDWAEISYQYTDINNALYSDSPLFSGNQSFKDKSFDAKFRLAQESTFLPSIAVGGRDIAGTGVFSSEYIVASKMIGHIDFSLGIGWGALSGNSITNPLERISSRFKTREKLDDSQGGEFQFNTFFSGPAGLFGGLEWYIPNAHGARFKIEYDGTNYLEEGFTELNSFVLERIRPASSKVNASFVYPLSNSLHLKFGYTKGNTLNFGFSYFGNFRKRNAIVPKNDPVAKVPNKDIVKRITSKEDILLYKATLKYLSERDFYVQKVNIAKNELSVMYSQSKYENYAMAAGRVTSILNDISPSYIDSFTLVNTNGGIDMHQIEIPRADFNRFKEYKYTTPLKREVAIKSPALDPSYEFTPQSIFPSLFWKINPALRTQVGGPNGFFFGDIRLGGHAEVLFKRNFSIVSSASIGLIDTFDTLKNQPNSILPHVRTDIVAFLKESRKFAIQNLQANYYIKPSKDLFVKLSGGILEEMFGGIGFETLYRPFDKNFAIGAELWSVKKRKFNQRLQFQDYETVTGYINYYYREPRSQILLAVKAGKFLAKDSGFNIDFSRRFKSGLRMGAFFAVTDISKEEFGEGSFDKGFYFFLPIDTFFNFYTKGEVGFGLRPITRDGAAFLNHSHHLWGVTDQAQLGNITRDWDTFYD